MSIRKILYTYVILCAVWIFGDYLAGIEPSRTAASLLTAATFGFMLWMDRE